MIFSPYTTVWVSLYYSFRSIRLLSLGCFGLIGGSSDRCLIFGCGLYYMWSYIVLSRSVFTCSGLILVFRWFSRWGCCRPRWNSVALWRILIVLISLCLILDCRLRSSPTTHLCILRAPDIPDPRLLFRFYLFTALTVYQMLVPQRLSCTLVGQFSYCLFKQ